MLLQATTVHITFKDTEEYSLRSIDILGCNIYSQITVAHVTLPKAVLSTVKIFAVYISISLIQHSYFFFHPFGMFPASDTLQCLVILKVQYELLARCHI